MRYIGWCTERKNTYSDDAVSLLREVREQFLACGLECEIILYDDHDAEPTLAGLTLLGYDVMGDTGESAIQQENRINDYYGRKLNENGLFKSCEEAAEFCLMWAGLIADGTSPWEVETNPRPFAVWLLEKV